MQDSRQARFAALYQRSSPQLLRYIRLTEKKSLPEAEDIIQDIFLKLWERRNRLSNIESLENYVFIMMKNQLINERKREHVKRNALQHIGDSRAINLTEQHVLYRELNKAFESSIHDLSPKMKQAFELQNAGVKTETIASHMSISISVVKNHLCKAKQRIRTRIALLHTN